MLWMSPTTALTNVEIEHVFKIMNNLREQGVSIIFISHKLNEVVAICDSYTIMRDGCVVQSGRVDGNITEEDLARYMVGKDLNYDELYKDRTIGGEILRTENLSRDREFKDINISVGKGEIVGITGLLGDGRFELMSTVYGCNKDYEGKIYLHDTERKMNHVQKARQARIAYLPRNRKENGIIKDLSVGEKRDDLHYRQDQKRALYSS